MSGNLAIAAVSAVMKYVILTPAPGNGISAVVPDLVVTAVPPHRVSEDAPCLNIFFYRAMVNSGWAQNGLPSRNSQGERVSNPYLALDLYYLITAHATGDYQGEILLGYAMQAFHENPVLPRAIIRTALTSSTLVTTETPAGVLAAFAAADLAEQIEQIKITPYFPAPEELSNLWSPLNTGYVPTANYKVTVVLIESRRPARSALPVRAYNLYALPVNTPHIEDVIAAAGAGLPILAGARVALRGSALRGDDTRVVVGGVEISNGALDISNERIEFNLPTGLPAGITGVQVRHLLNIGTPPTEHRGLESNVVAFVLQPQITQTGPNYDIQIIPAGGGQPRRLQISLDPPVSAEARAMVLLNELNAPSTRAAFLFSFQASSRSPEDPPAAQLTFAIPNVPAGDYLVRVRINGAESPLNYVSPDGYLSPAVTLP
ncbi:MAG: DUF4255 domain-containing protein [Anaerolineae bacterium]|nr:DUF4255 domain-containing protein [Anaerolineae bacterium]